MLAVLSIQKVFGIAAYSGGMAEVLTFFALGILVCATLYAACAFYEAVLTRRKASWNQFRERIKDQLPEG